MRNSRARLVLSLVFIFGGVAGCRHEFERELAQPVPDIPTAERVAERVAELSLTAQVRLVREGLRETIRIEDSLVSAAEFRMLADLPQLAELELHSTSAGDDEVQLLAVGRLRRLVLRGARLTDAALGHISQFTSLTVLNIPDADFSDQGLASLASLPRLELLRFGSPRVTDRGIVALEKMKSLRFLHLIDVRLTDESVRSFVRMEHLESLYLDGARLTDEGVLRLLAARPALHLHFDQAHHDRDPRRGHDATPASGGAGSQ